MELVIGDDGQPRCSWGTSTPDYVHYHDTEWGFGVTSDVRLFEKVCLEGFQSGLSWLTILRKREGFRAAFAGFDPGPSPRSASATSNGCSPTPASCATRARSARRSTTPLAPSR